MGTTWIGFLSSDGDFWYLAVSSALCQEPDFPSLRHTSVLALINFQNRGAASPAPGRDTHLWPERRGLPTSRKPQPRFMMLTAGLTPCLTGGVSRGSEAPPGLVPMNFKPYTDVSSPEKPL